MASGRREALGRRRQGRARVDSSAVGARIEAPKAPRRVGCGDGVSPFPPREGTVLLLPINFQIFQLKKVSFGAFWD